MSIQHPKKCCVSDYNNQRVQRYASTAALLNFSAAEVTVFGIQGNFTVTQATVNGIYQLTIVNTTMILSDGDSCRVLRIDGVTTANATIPLATNVYGQTNFTQNICTGATLNDMSSPYGVAVSNNQTMWVADQGNNLVKRFDNVLSLPNYQAPNGFFGINATNNLTQSTFNNLQYLALDRVNGHLFVSDGGRILLFKNAATKGNSSAADTVIGSTDFVSTASACNASQINGAVGISYDSNTNSLFVADSGNSRVLVFSSPAAAANGSAATAQIGQADLTTCVAPGGVANASNINPWDVTYSPDFPGLFVLIADTGFSRVSRHQCSNSTFSATTTRSASVPASSIVPNSSSGVPASSSGVIASSSGAVAASSSGAVAASSSGAVAASSSGAIAASSSGVVASSSGVVANSSVIVANSSVNASVPASVAASSAIPPSGSDTASGPALSISGTSSKSLSNTPSETNPNALTPSNSAIAPPPPVVFGTSGVKLAVCGNGALEAGEECDPGAAVPRTKCCTQFCTSLAVRAVCGRATSQCTKRPKCGRSQTSRQLVCNAGVAKPVGTRCGRGGLFSRKTCKADGTCSK